MRKTSVSVRDVKIPRGYDAKKQKIVGLFAGQLDDQLKLLADQVKDLTVEQLEWQYRSGMNTIGMLLAHLAVVDLWWGVIAPKGLPEPDGDVINMKIIGIRMDDDGLPLASDGKHPQSLAGKSAIAYLDMLAKARRAVHKELKTWNDAKLPKRFIRRRGKKRIEITHTWALYHLLEHFAGHFGQILLVKHMLRDAGLLSTPAR
jgi:uncharacterized damage-inducible protein DinB